MRFTYYLVNKAFSGPLHAKYWRIFIIHEIPTNVFRQRFLLIPVICCCLSAGLAGSPGQMTHGQAGHYVCVSQPHNHQHIRPLLIPTVY
jgi:hypothetical protein